jgi:DNA-binding response OmpR family regulator
MSRSTVLVVDDEREVQDLVATALGGAGLDVICASDGPSGLEIALAHRPDVIILDLRMPGLDGLEICRRLRANDCTQATPLIMLTASSEETDRVVGLELGADDYVSKPFSPRELIARVRAMLRRAQPQRQIAVGRWGALAIDVPRHQVTYMGRPIDLSPREFRILHCIASEGGQVVAREEIIHRVCDESSPILDRSVDVHVASIRKKLGEQNPVETVRGIGYRLRVAPDAA